MRCLKHPSSLYVKGSLRSAMTSVKTEATNGLVINQINTSNVIQIILIKFSVIIISLPLTFIFLTFQNMQNILINDLNNLNK